MSTTKKPTTKPVKRGRPVALVTKGTQVAVRLDAAEADALDALCAKFGVTRSDVLRWAVRDAVSGEWFPSQFKRRA